MPVSQFSLNNNKILLLMADSKYWLIAICMLLSCLQAGFVYKGEKPLASPVQQLQFSSGRLITTDKFIVRATPLNGSLPEFQIPFFPPLLVTSNRLLLQKVEGGPVSIAQKNDDPTLVFPNIEDLILEPGVFVDDGAVYMPVSGGLLSVGKLLDSGEVQVKKIQEGQYFEFGPISPVGANLLSVGCREHIYLLDKPSLALVQKITLPKTILTNYQVIHSKMNTYDQLTVGTNTFQWIYRKNEGQATYKLIGQIRIPNIRAILYEDTTAWALSSSCELLNSDLSKMDCLISSSSREYLVDKNMAVSTTETLFLQSSGNIQQLNLNDYSLNVIHRLPDSDTSLLQSASFLNNDKEILTLRNNILMRYSIDKSTFSAPSLENVLGFAVSPNEKYVASVSLREGKQYVGIYDSATFQRLMESEFPNNSQIFHNIHQAKPQISPLKYVFLLVLKNQQKQVKSYSLVFDLNQKTIIWPAKPLLISSTYQIVQYNDITSLTWLADSALFVQKWNGDSLQQKYLSRQPAFMKTAGSRIMLVYADGISDFYTAEIELKYEGSHYKSKNGAEYSTILLGKLQLVYTYSQGGVWYDSRPQKLPIFQKSQLQASYCSSLYSTTLILRPQTDPTHLALMVASPKLSLFTLITVVWPKGDGFTMYTNVTLPKGYKLDADPKLAYNQNRDTLYLTAKTGADVVLAGVRLNTAVSRFQWEWSHSWKRIDDFSFNQAGELVVVGETAYGKAYKFQPAIVPLPDITLPQVIASSRTGDCIVVQKDKFITILNPSNQQEKINFPVDSKMTAAALNVDGDIIIAQDSTGKWKWLQIGKQTTYPQLPTPVSLAFLTRTVFYVETNEQIQLYQLDDDTRACKKIYSSAISSPSKLTYTSTHLAFQRKTVLVVVTVQGSEIQTLSLFGNNKIDALTFAHNQLIAASAMSLLSWNQQECTGRHYNKNGKCTCPQNARESDSMCTCSTGFFYNEQLQCSQCGILCDSCDNANECTTYNYALFASGVAAVLCVVALLWCIIVHLKKARQLRNKNSLLSESLTSSAEAYS